jgi:predicted MFS family arabinose efflux permease
VSDKECPVPEPFSGAIGSILFLTLLFFLTFIGRFIFAPLMPAMSRELGLSHSQAGSIFLFGSVGAFIGSLSAAFVSSHIKHKGTIALSLIGTSSALLLCTMLTPLLAIRGAVLMLGLMAGMNLPSNVATITALVSRQDWGKALAVQQMAPPLSLILGPVITVFLLNWFSWRAPMVVIAVAGIAAAVILIRFGTIGQFPGDAPDLSLARIILSGRSFWIMIILFALGMGGQVGIYAMMPLYLIAERGMPEASANMLVGLSQVSALFMTFFAGWVTDRIGEKKSHRRFSFGLRDRHHLAGPGLRSLAEDRCVPSAGPDCVLFPGGFRRACTDRAAESSKSGYRLGDTVRYRPGWWSFPRTAGIHGADGNICKRHCSGRRYHHCGIRSAFFARAD